MSDPSLVIRQGERDDKGHLQPEHMAEIRRVLGARGFVLLPSDTAFSIAVWLHSTRVRRQVNALLDREDEPVSFAFPSPAVVRRWVAKNDAAQRLLETFTPGPITVVCRASPLIPAVVTRELMGSRNHTIGVRIPNSTEERQVAGVGTSIITTVPVRKLKAEGKPPVTSFAEAMALVRDRIGAFEGAPWSAIDGAPKYPATSTVVEVLGRGWSYTIRRKGAIPEEQIRACLQRQPGG